MSEASIELLQQQLLEINQKYSLLHHGVDDLYGFAKVISSHSERADIFKATLEESLKTTSSSAGLIAWLDDKKENLKVIESIGIQSTEALSWNLQEKILGEVFTSCINRVFPAEEVKNYPKEHNLGLQHILILPLILEDKAEGLLVLSRKAEDPCFSADDIKVVMVITSQMVMRFKNLELMKKYIEAEKIGAWKDSARKLAHEIKNPLTPIQLTALSLMDEDFQKSPKFIEMLNDSCKTILNEVSRLTDLVNEFSRFARMPLPKMEPVNLNNLIAESLKIYAKPPEGITVTDELDENAAVDLLLDQAQIKEVIINLVKNAQEAMTNGGAIKVKTLAKDDKIYLMIEDNGSGMSEKVKEHIFDPYYTTKKEGTGLGLALVKRIITDHNGEIQVESEIDKGTTFTLTFPKNS